MLTKNISEFLGQYLGYLNVSILDKCSISMPPEKPQKTFGFFWRFLV